MTVGKALFLSAIAGISTAVVSLVAPQTAAAFTITSGGYTATNTAYSFIDIAKERTSRRLLNNQDDAAAFANLGFTFNFFGVNYTQVGVSSNGLLSFGGLNSSPTNADLTQTTPTFPTLAALWDDWDVRGAGAVYTQTRTINGQQAFVVQWDRVTNKNLGANSLATFQAILFSGSNNILLNYQNVAVGGTGNNGGSATVGVANDKTARRLQWSYNSQFSAYQVRNNTSILIRPTN